MKNASPFLFSAKLVLIVSAVAGILVAVTSNNALLGLELFLAISAAVPAIVLMSLGTIFVAILVHELGHYVFGRLAGLQLLQVVVVSCGIRFDGVRYRFFKPMQSNTAGYVMMYPQNRANFKRKYALFIAGGPVFSICYLGLWLWIWSAFASKRVPEGSGLGITMLSLIAPFYWICAAVILLSTVRPFNTKSGQQTDALMLQTILHKDFVTDRLFASLMHYKEALLGARPRDWTREYLDEQCLQSDGTIYELSSLIPLIEFLADSESHELPSVIERQKEVLAKLPAMPKLWHFQTAYIQQAFYAFRNDDLAEGERWLALITEPITGTKGGYLLAKAYHALLAGEFQDAISLVDESESIYREGHSKLGGNIEFAIETMASIKERALKSIVRASDTEA